MIWAYTTYCGPGLQDGNRRRMDVSAYRRVGVSLEAARYIAGSSSQNMAVDAPE
jgi:hypothetical protein